MNTFIGLTGTIPATNGLSVVAKDVQIDGPDLSATDATVTLTDGGVIYTLLNLIGVLVRRKSGKFLKEKQ